MVQMRTWLTVADNSGARQLTCILPVGGDAGLTASLGDVVTAAVKEAQPESFLKSTFGRWWRLAADAPEAGAVVAHLHRDDGAALAQPHHDAAGPPVAVGVGQRLLEDPVEGDLLRE